MRSSKSRSRSKNNRNRNPLGNIVNRVFDSSGPEGKVRGTPQQIIDKYNQLARDASLSNDRVAAENFQQHAEHYLRMLAEAQREQDAKRDQQERENRERQAQRDRERADRDGDRPQDDSDESRSRPDQPRADQQHSGQQRPDLPDQAKQDQPRQDQPKVSQDRAERPRQTDEASGVPEEAGRAAERTGAVTTPEGDGPGQPQSQPPQSQQPGAEKPRKPRAPRKPRRKPDDTTAPVADAAVQGKSDAASVPGNGQDAAPTSDKPAPRKRTRKPAAAEVTQDGNDQTG